MSTPEDFRSQFDAEGRFQGGNGELPVIFATRGGGRFPGKFFFRDGLCYRAEMERGGDWGLPDESPLDGVRFFLYFGNDRLSGVAVDHGRVIPLEETPTRSAGKRDFLANFRIARNLFVHGKVAVDSPTIDTAVNEHCCGPQFGSLQSPFPASMRQTFPTGGQPTAGIAVGRPELFAVAREVPSDRPATAEQYGNAAVAFERSWRFSSRICRWRTRPEVSKLPSVP